MYLGNCMSLYSWGVGKLCTCCLPDGDLPNVQPRISFQHTLSVLPSFCDCCLFLQVILERLAELDKIDT